MNIRSLKTALEDKNYTINIKDNEVTISEKDKSVNPEDVDEEDLDRKTFVINKTELEKQFLDLQYSINNEPISIYNPNYFETVVSAGGTRNLFLIRKIAGKYFDLTNNISYEFSNDVSLDMAIEISKHQQGRAFCYFNEEQSPTEKLKEILINHSYRVCSIKIKSDKNIPLEDFVKYCTSFLFTIAYQSGVGYSFFDAEKMNQKRPIKTYRSTEFEAPKKQYEQKLVNKYISGLESSDLISKFLSFYHVLEFYMDTEYDSDVLNYFKSEITSPGFYKRDRQLRKIVDHIIDMKKSFNEQESLKKILEKYIDVQKLKDDLIEFDLLDFFISNSVSFSGGDKILFNDSIPKATTDSISKRVYKTRNAIVHSKSDQLLDKELRVYNPYRDQDSIKKEIQLIKLLSEQIIINTAKDI